MPQLPLIPGTIPPGMCFASDQERWNFFFQNGYAQGPDIVGIIVSDTAPGIEFQVGYGWIKTIGGSPGKLYTFNNGSWVSEHTVPASSDVRQLWVGSLLDLESYDGGSAGEVTATSGPMWEEDTDFIGRSPMHPGAIPGSDPAASIAVGQDLGAGSRAFTISDMPEHQHVMKFGSGTSGSIFPAVTTSATSIFDFSTEPTGSATTPTPVSMLHPVRGCYLIKRTARTHYVAAGGSAVVGGGAQQVYSGTPPPPTPFDPSLPAVFYPFGSGTMKTWDVPTQQWL